MKILINNDDRYQFSQLKVLAREAETRGEITVAAVDANPSDAGNRSRLRVAPMRHGAVGPPTRRLSGCI